MQHLKSISRMCGLLSRPVNHNNRRISHIYSRGKVASTKIPFAKDSMPPSNINVWPISKYGSENIVSLLVGPSLVGQRGAMFITRLFETAKVPVVFERMFAGSDNDNIQEILYSVHRNRNALQVYLPHDPVEKQKNLLLNNELDLFACIIRLRSYEGFRCKHDNVCLTIISQNNTGNYSKLEYMPVPGLVHTLRCSQDSSTQRYLRFTFSYARQHNHSKVTVVHKANELPLTDGRFLKIARMVHCEYPDICLEEMNVNDVVLNLIERPCIFDLICSSDMYGTIVTAVASSVCGGAGLFSAIEVGEHHAVFKPLSAKLTIPEARDLAPYGVVRSCIDLLQHLGNISCAGRVERQLLCTMLEAGIKTPEFCGTDSGEYVIAHIVNNLECKFHS